MLCNVLMTYFVFSCALSTVKLSVTVSVTLHSWVDISTPVCYWFSILTSGCVINFTACKLHSLLFCWYVSSVIIIAAQSRTRLQATQFAVGGLFQHLDCLFHNHVSFVYQLLQCSCTKGKTEGNVWRNATRANLWMWCKCELESVVQIVVKCGV